MRVSAGERYKKRRPWWARNWKERILFCVVGLIAAAVTLLLLLPCFHFLNALKYKITKMTATTMTNISKP
jgi:putative flippase GtrA